MEYRSIFYNTLDSLFHFTLDVSATKENTKCTKYYTISDDGLSHNWEGNCWVNPPYGRCLSKWVSKAYKESLNGCTVVCLIPSKTDTLYYHKIIFPYARVIVFVKGRLKFHNGSVDNKAPSAHCVVVFSNNNVTDSQLKGLRTFGHVLNRNKKV